jgi:hypothetical protein
LTRAIGGAGYDFAWGKKDDADSIAAIHRSLELGVNWIDTAPVFAYTGWLAVFTAALFIAAFIQVGLFFWQLRLIRESLIDAGGCRSGQSWSQGR